MRTARDFYSNFYTRDEVFNLHIIPGVTATSNILQ